MVMKLPGGPSNSAGMGATPGTQQTAQKNASFGNLNPNMPSGPQIQRQAASPYQQSLRPNAPMPMNRPGGAPMGGRQAPGRGPSPRQMPGRADPRVVSRTSMDPGRGYNIMAGMSPDEIMQANSSMGLSNMTAIPSLVGANNMQLQPNQLQNRMAMEGDGSNPFTELQEYEYQGGGGVPDLNAPVQGENTNPTLDGSIEDNAAQDAAYEHWGNSNISQLSPSSWDEFWAGAQGAFNDPANVNVPMTPDEIEAKEAGMQSAVEGKYRPEVESNMQSIDQIIAMDTPGLDPDKKQESIDLIGEKYASQLQAALSGLDRQMAMMGTFNSGSHSFAFNNTVSSGLAAMADEINEINKMDLEQVEKDYEETIITLGNMNEQFMKMDAADADAKQAITDAASALSEDAGELAIAIINNAVDNIPDPQKSDIINLAFKATGKMLEDIANGVDPDKALQTYLNELNSISGEPIIE